MPEHIVEQGDSISSLAYQYGLPPNAIWNHPSNAALKTKRKNPDTLYPGDGVFIPEIRLREEDRSTDKQHKFVAHHVPAKLRLRLLRNDDARANEEFTLWVDGSQLMGSTDAQGWVEAAIPASAREARLVMVATGEEIELSIGHLDPLDEVTGIQGRLRNLGYYDGEIDGELSEDVKEAIRAFQAKHGLQETGEANASTKDDLRAAYGH